MAQSEIKALLARLGDALNKSIAESHHMTAVAEEMRTRGLDFLILLDARVTVIEGANFDSLMPTVEMVIN